jgi:hypothetical protein
MTFWHVPAASPPGILCGVGAGPSTTIMASAAGAATD